MTNTQNIKATDRMPLPRLARTDRTSAEFQCQMTLSAHRDQAPPQKRICDDDEMTENKSLLVGLLLFFVLPKKKPTFFTC